MGSDLGMSTVPSVTTGRLSSKKVPFLKFPVAFPASISGGKASTMSWDDQVSAEQGRNLVSFHFLLFYFIFLFHFYFSLFS